MEIKMLEIHHHRNGIAGEPFYVGFLEDDDSGKKLFIHFNDDSNETGEWANPRTAILDTSKIADNDVRFGSNSFRGDHYSDFIKSEIDKLNN